MTTTTRTCPHCAEPMQETARICPHCRRGPNRDQIIRGFVLTGLAVVALLGGVCAYGIESVQRADRARQEAEVRRMMGPPPPTAEDAALMMKQYVFRTAKREGIDVAARRWEKTRAEVEAILREGEQAGW